jgi:hypothetical protein
MPTSFDKLSSCKQRFDSWRKDSSNSSNRRIIPDSLWKEAIQLIGTDFSISLVAHELGLNQARLRQKQIELSAASLSKKTLLLICNSRSKKRVELVLRFLFLLRKQSLLKPFSTLFFVPEK